jgi:hypothetical protein
MNLDTVLNLTAALIGAGTYKGIDLYLHRSKTKAENDKTKVETALLVQEMYQKLLDSLNQNIEQQDLRIKGLSERINRSRLQEQELLAQLQEQKQVNKQSHLLYQALEIEVGLLRNLLNQSKTNMRIIKVSIADDYQVSLDMFRMSLSRISVIDLSTHATAQEVIDNLSGRPDILVLDYNLDGEHTAETVLEEVEKFSDYYPKIIVMSAQPLKDIEQLFLGKDIWKFYSKTDLYISEITRTIMEYVREVTL